MSPVAPAVSPVPPATTAAPRRLVATVVGLCWLVVFFDGLDLFVYGAVLPDMLADAGLGLSVAEAGTVGSLATLGMLVGALSAGTITDWVGRKKVIVTACTIFSVASGICAVAPTYQVFGAGRFVAGLGLGGLLPTAIALVAESAPTARRNLLIGALMTAHHVGGIAAALLGLGLLQAIGWRGIFWIGVIPLVVAVPLVQWLMPESLAFLVAKGRHAQARAVADRYGVRIPPPESGAAPRVGTTRGVWAGLAELFAPGRRLVTPLLWVSSFAGLLLVYGVSTWLPTLMRAQGYQLGSALAFLLVVNVGGVVGMLVAGRFADHRGPVRVAALWFAATAASVFILGVRLPLVVTYGTVFLAGLFLFSAQTMVYAAAATAYDTNARATAIGWASGIGRFGAVVGPWMGGALLAAGHQSWGFTAFALFAVLATTTMLAVLLVLRRPR